MDQATIVALLVGTPIGVVVQFFVIKGAVKSAIVEARDAPTATPGEQRLVGNDETPPTA